MASAPRPPACVNAGAPAAQQRRAALDFLSRELRSLEIDASHSRKLEARIEALNEELLQAQQAAQMYMRRCDMLESELQRERALQANTVAEGEGVAVKGREPQPTTPSLAPATPAPRMTTSLGAAAAKLPPAPSPSACAASLPINIGQHAGSFPAAAVASAPSLTQFDDMEADVEALIQAQRALPVMPSQLASQGTGGRSVREPMRVRGGVVPGAAPVPSGQGS
jgi:hypothetical protein